MSHEETSLRIGVLGQIVAGEQCGEFVKFIRDESTGGYLVLTGRTPELRDGADSWVESLESLRQYVAESAWRIEWRAAPR